MYGASNEWVLPASSAVPVSVSSAVAVSPVPPVAAFGPASVPLVPELWGDSVLDEDAPGCTETEIEGVGCDEALGVGAFVEPLGSGLGADPDALGASVGVDVEPGTSAESVGGALDEASLLAVPLMLGSPSESPSEVVPQLLPRAPPHTRVPSATKCRMRNEAVGSMIECARVVNRALHPIYGAPGR